MCWFAALNISYYYKLQKNNNIIVLNIFVETVIHFFFQDSLMISVTI